jgi:hypothetical protein
VETIGDGVLAAGNRQQQPLTQQFDGDLKVKVRGLDRQNLIEVGRAGDDMREEVLAVPAEEEIFQAFARAGIYVKSLEAHDTLDFNRASEDWLVPRPFEVPAEKSCAKRLALSRTTGKKLAEGEQFCFSRVGLDRVERRASRLAIRKIGGVKVLARAGERRFQDDLEAMGGIGEHRQVREKEGYFSGDQHAVDADLI